MNYKEAGVNVELGDLFVERIKPFIKETYNENVRAGVGGFAALYAQGSHYLVAGTDGVGTKLKLATELNKHSTIGIDLVAMCVNDILCTGARPAFFLDYMAIAKLNIDIHQDVIKGIAEGCKQAGCALIGGETAEMPGMYATGDYDLAGFSVGILNKPDYIDGSKIEAGMKIYGLKASGFHSNGYSLIRKLIENQPDELKLQCLNPTKIYVKEVLDILDKTEISGMAHITGGGFNNIARMNSNFGYEIENLPPLPDFMDKVISLANLSVKELYTTFNMGIGFTLIAKETDFLNNHSDILTLGTVKDTFKGVKCLGEDLN